MTTYNSDVITKNANRSAHGESRDAQHAYGIVTLPTALVAGDVINFLKLPPYARVTSACLQATQLDTNGAPTLAVTVGDSGVGITGGTNFVAADTARYFTATTVGRAAAPGDANATTAMNGRAQNFLNNQASVLPIFATVTVAAATFATGTMSLRVTYFVDEPASVLNQ